MTSYTPILRWKRGERTALRNLTQAGRVDVKPLIILGAEHYSPRSATATRPAMNAAEALAADVLSYWGTEPFYLDVSRLPVQVGGQHALVAISQACRAAGLQMLPAFTLAGPAHYLAAVALVVAIDGRGAALRVDLQEFATAALWAGGIGLAVQQIHLIADFGSNVANVAALGHALVQTFISLHQAGAWASVTVAGCSLPENFTGFAQGQHLIPRHEWGVWHMLAPAVAAYNVGYGDYATVAPSAPPPGIAWGFPINVKYTVDTDFLVCRGVKTTGPAAMDMDVQLRGHANSVVAYGPRKPISNCWGDTRINQIAAGIEGPGNLEKWVQISVNRHIEKIRHDLP